MGGVPPLKAFVVVRALTTDRRRIGASDLDAIVWKCHNYKSVSSLLLIQYNHRNYGSLLLSRRRSDEYDFVGFTYDSLEILSELSFKNDCVAVVNRIANGIIVS